MPGNVKRTPTEIATEYFARVRARDPRVVELFHEDAELIGLGTRRQGRPAIDAFYRDIIERAGPTPRQIGALLSGDKRVAAEILIELPGGATVHAVDVFDTDEGLIRTLTYFIATE